MKNIFKLIALICVAISFSSCEELLTNTDIVSSQVPSGGVSQGYSLHDAKWTFRSIGSYKSTVGECYYALQNQNYVVTNAALNCVTENNTLAKKVKKAMNDGTWISRENPYPLSVSVYKNVVYKYVDQLTKKRVDDLSIIDVWPARFLLSDWCPPASRPYNPHYKLLNGKLESQTGVLNKTSYVYTTQKLFGQKIKAIAQIDESNPNWRISVNCPSEEMAELIQDIFSLYYNMQNTNIFDNNVLYFEVDDGRYPEFSFYLENFDVITYQSLECILLTNGLLDMEYIKANY